MRLFGAVLYALAAVGFIGWAWHCCAAQNRIARQRHNDDLTEISGIGPVIAGKLRKLGYTRFEQIARLTPQDIERVNAQLNFKGRIEREQWVKQARGLVLRYK